MVPVRNLLARSLDKTVATLTQALEAYRGNPSGEPLHDLRVALRRTAALAALFRNIPADGDGRAERDAAQELRRGLSAARQNDVSRGLLTDLTAEEPDLAPAIAALLPSFTAETTSSAASAVSGAEQIVSLLSAWKERAAGVSGEDEGAFRGKVSKRLRKARKKLLSFGKPTRKTLHEERIAGKALRYRLELLAGALPSAAPLVKASKSFQDALGEAHDWACLLEDVRARVDGLPRIRRAGALALVIVAEEKRAERLETARSEAEAFFGILRDADLTVPEPPAPPAAAVPAEAKPRSPRPRRAAPRAPRAPRTSRK
ncbi:MAG: CHAD domain-containing protein [Acidobacteria bacterium]|nr:CHAD domain-containing protein [Acidobacteriota bacterium]